MTVFIIFTLQKFTNFHAVRSWSFHNICNEIGWPCFFAPPCICRQTLYERRNNWLLTLCRRSWQRWKQWLMVIWLLSLSRSTQWQKLWRQSSSPWKHWKVSLCCYYTQYRPTQYSYNLCLFRFQVNLSSKVAEVIWYLSVCPSVCYKNISKVIDGFESNFLKW